ncbi:MAG: uracil-DNA glycosylase [Gammaproteobacteria bacterium]|nr:MAG: uracil-DNA glycosylase [Gammaproteobacteria bacterium]
MSAEARRRAYLEALDIDVWTPRGADPAGAMEEVEVAPQALTTDWDGLRQQVAACTLCSLHRSRTQTVFGVGNQAADWMIVGEAPGAEEDQRGEPFVGRAGKLLDEMLRAVGLQRDAVFIANILKCRPPNNRDPLVEEASSCRAYLERQIQLAAPKLILAVGRVAAQHLLGSDAPVGRLRGQKHTLNGGQLPVVVTYHPAYLLRSPTQKRKVWQDLCMARQIMEQPDQ